MKLAGGGDLSEIDTAAFLEQAAEFDSTGDLRESLIKLRMTAFMTHPLPVARAADLRRWIDDGALRPDPGRRLPAPRHRSGRFGRCGTRRLLRTRTVNRFKRSQDPLVGLLRKLGDGASGVGDVVGAGASRVRRVDGRQRFGGAGDSGWATAPAE